jgi:DNA transposition AAA+ family ATPase
MTNFCETSIASIMFDTIDIVRRSNINAAIIGPPGIGKTFTASHYVANNSGAYLLTATAASGNAARHLFKAFCEKVEFSSSGSIADIQNRLFNYDFSGRVLIVDEAQNLNLQGIRELLYLNDEAKLSIVFCGNDEVIKRTHVDQGPLATIGSRIYCRKQLSLITTDDAAAIAKAFGVDDDDATALCRAIGARSQARGLTFVLKSARNLAGECKPLKAAHIESIIREYPQYRPALAKR